MPARKPATLQYVCLTLLFVVTCAFQVRAIAFAFPALFGINAVSWPAIPDYKNAVPVLGFVTGSAQQAGIHEGDQILSVNGRPFTGLAVFGEEISRSKPGEPMTIGFRSKSDPAARLATFTLEPDGMHNVPLGGLLVIGAIKLVLPVFCLLLGFWVAFARPRDVSAWLLIPVLVGICTVYGVGIESWGPGVRDVAVVFRLFVNMFWPVSMLLFGIYFPENFEFKPPTWIRIPVWIVSVGLFLTFVLGAIHDVG